MNNGFTAALNWMRQNNAPENVTKAFERDLASARYALEDFEPLGESSVSEDYEEELDEADRIIDLIDEALPASNGVVRRAEVPSTADLEDRSVNR